MEHDNAATARTRTPEAAPDMDALLEAIETQRTELMIVNALLNCSRFTLLNDPLEEVSPSEHSDVLLQATRMLNAIITKLDSVQLTQAIATEEPD